MPDGPLDNAVWRYELNPDVPGYNHEVQGYTNDMRNARIESGKLVIEAHREPYTYPHDPLHRQFEITSAFIDTKNSLNFEYGKFEVTMRMPKGEGTWPAFWFLSVNQPYTRKLHPSDKDLMNERYALHDGELDGVEAYGSQPGVIESTVHSFDKTTQKQITVADAEEVFHTYGVEIRPDRLVWTLDGEPYYNIQKSSNNPNEWPFGNGNRFYAILNLAMGGTGGGPVNPADSDWRLEIAAAKFYKYINR